MNINDFVQDFPNRCSVLLKETRPVAEGVGMEVSATLCIAAAGMIIPHERLSTKHPFGDRKRFDDAREAYEKFCGGFFIGSSLAGNPDAWAIGTATLEWGNPESWGKMRDGILYKAISGEKKVKGVVDILRNALAHGSIWTEVEGNEERDIGSVVFLSVKDKIPCEGFAPGTPVGLPTPDVRSNRRHNEIRQRSDPCNARRIVSNSVNRPVAW